MARLERGPGQHAQQEGSAVDRPGRVLERGLTGRVLLLLSDTRRADPSRIASFDPYVRREGSHDEGTDSRGSRTVPIVEPTQHARSKAQAGPDAQVGPRRCVLRPETVREVRLTLRTHSHQGARDRHQPRSRRGWPRASSDQPNSSLALLMRRYRSTETPSDGQLARRAGRAAPAPDRL